MNNNYYKYYSYYYLNSYYKNDFFKNYYYFFREKEIVSLFSWERFFFFLKGKGANTSRRVLVLLLYMNIHPLPFRVARQSSKHKFSATLQHIVATKIPDLLLELHQAIEILAT